jgi:hypothetical protein
MYRSGFIMRAIRPEYGVYKQSVSLHYSKSW